MIASAGALKKGSFMVYESGRINSPSFFIGRSGNGIISFGSGAADLPPPEKVQHALDFFSGKEAVLYGPIQGEPELRETLSRKSEARGIPPENIIITNGASEALNLALTTLPANSKVLLMKPYYYSYPFLAKFNKLKAVYCPMKNDSIDIAAFAEKVKGCSAALVNSPCNPTGQVEKPETIKWLAKICEDENCLLVFDEVYSELIYEGEHYSPRGQHVLGVNSFSKTFSLCGLRVGYAYSENAGFITKMVEAKNHISMNTSLLSQRVALAAINASKSYMEKNRLAFRKRRDLIYSGLKGMGFELRKPKGAFYALPRVENPQKFIEGLFFGKKVIAYNGEWFGAEKRVRFSYALNEDKIKEGLARLKEFVKENSFI